MEEIDLLGQVVEISLWVISKVWSFPIPLNTN